MHHFIYVRWLCSGTFERLLKGNEQIFICTNNAYIYSVYTSVQMLCLWMAVRESNIPMSHTERRIVVEALITCFSALQPVIDEFQGPWYGPVLQCIAGFIVWGHCSSVSQDLLSFGVSTLVHHRTYHLEPGFQCIIGLIICGQCCSASQDLSFGASAAVRHRTFHLGPVLYHSYNLSFGASAVVHHRTYCLGPVLQCLLFGVSAQVHCRTSFGASALVLCRTCLLEPVLQYLSFMVCWRKGTNQSYWTKHAPGSLYVFGTYLAIFFLIMSTKSNKLQVHK